MEVQPLLTNLWSSQPKSWKKNLWPRPAPSWISFIVREIFLFPFFMPKFLLLYEAVPLSALTLKISSEIPSWKYHYFLNYVLPFKNRFLLDHVMLFYVTQRPWCLGFFFYQLVGFQEAEDKSHPNFLTHSWLPLSWIVCGTGFYGSSLHFMVLNDIYNLNVTDWLF